MEIAREDSWVKNEYVTSAIGPVIVVRITAFVVVVVVSSFMPDIFVRRPRASVPQEDRRKINKTKTEKNKKNKKTSTVTQSSEISPNFLVIISYY